MDIRRRYRRSAPISVAAWAERYRWVMDGPLVGAGSGGVKWSNDVFPPGVEIMNSSEGGRFRRTLCLASPQSSGKTALGINCVLHPWHQRSRDVLYMNATAAKAQNQFAKKIEPAIARDPTLRMLVPDAREERGRRTVHRYRGGLEIHVTGAESEAELSGSTVPVIFADDAHAMSAAIGPHGHPIEFAERRQGAYPTEERVTFVAGQASDTENWLWRQLFVSTFYCLYVPCLACGTYQLLDWDRMVFDDSSPTAAARHCWMRCAGPGCDHRIEDRELPEMLRRHAWVSTPPGLDPVHEPGTRTGLRTLEGEFLYPDTARPAADAGFTWNAFAWPLVSWGHHAAEFVACRDHADSLMGFRQQTLAKPEPPRVVEVGTLSAADIETHRAGAHHWRSVPAASGAQRGDGVVLVTADVQGGYIWWLAVAWRKSDGAAWVVECGKLGARPAASDYDDSAALAAERQARIIRALEGLYQRCAAGWDVTDDAGEIVGHVTPERQGIDCSYHRRAVQTFCRLRNGGRPMGPWRPVEGSQAIANSPKVPAWPDRDMPEREKRKDAHGRAHSTAWVYWPCNTNTAKLRVLDLLSVPVGQPGSLTIAPDTPESELNSLTKQWASSEYSEATRRWRCPSKADHLFDCAAMQVAMLPSVGVRLTAAGEDAEREPSHAPPPPKPLRRNERTESARPPVRREY